MARLRATAALAKEAGTVVDALTDFPETSATQEILDLKTQTARDVNGSRASSPPPGRPLRRETMKFVDERKRAE